MATPRISVSMKGALVLNKQKSNELKKTVTDLKNETKKSLCFLSSTKELIGHEMMTSNKKKSQHNTKRGLNLHQYESARTLTTPNERDRLLQLSGKSDCLLPPISSANFSAASAPSSPHAGIQRRHGLTQNSSNSNISMRSRKISLPAKLSVSKDSTYFRAFSSDKFTTRETLNSKQSGRSQTTRKLSSRSQDESLVLPTTPVINVETCTDRQGLRRCSSLSDLEKLMNQLKDCRYLRVSSSREDVDLSSRTES